MPGAEARVGLEQAHVHLHGAAPPVRRRGRGPRASTASLPHRALLSRCPTSRGGDARALIRGDTPQRPPTSQQRRPAPVKGKVTERSEGPPAAMAQAGRARAAILLSGSARTARLSGSTEQGGHVLVRGSAGEASAASSTLTQSQPRGRPPRSAAARRSAGRAAPAGRRPPSAGSPTTAPPTLPRGGAPLPAPRPRPARPLGRPRPREGYSARGPRRAQAMTAPGSSAAACPANSGSSSAPGSLGLGSSDRQIGDRNGIRARVTVRHLKGPLTPAGIPPIQSCHGQSRPPEMTPSTSMARRRGTRS